MSGLFVKISDNQVKVGYNANINVKILMVFKVIFCKSYLKLWDILKNFQKANLKAKSTKK